MIRALITGVLYSEPTARTAQSGKQYATAKVRADAKEGATVWCSIIAFGELADRLMTLSANSAVAVSGKVEVIAYTNKQGEPAAGLSIVVDQLATLKGKPRPSQGERDTRQHHSAQRSKPAHGPDPAPRPDFNDELPEFM